MRRLALLLLVLSLALAAPAQKKTSVQNWLFLKEYRCRKEWQ
jgi:hypothetical protein